MSCNQYQRKSFNNDDLHPWDAKHREHTAEEIDTDRKDGDGKICGGEKTVEKRQEKRGDNSSSKKAETGSCDNDKDERKYKGCKWNV